MKKLDRDLGLVSIIAIAIGSMIGGGIFILPGLAAKYTGASLWLAYLISGCLIIPAALSQSEMATAMPKAGGVYVFVDRSMGPMFGTIAGIGTWLAMMLKASFALVGIGTYLSVFSSLPIIPVALVLLCGIAVLNIFGVKKVGKAQIVVVVLCLISLAALSIRGTGQLDMSHFQQAFPNGGMGLLSATGLVFISYAGVTKIASVAEEIKQPERNLPLAMLISLFLMMALYSFVSFVLVGVLPLKGSTAALSLAGNERPIALLAQHLYGNAGAISISVIAAIALASMANAGLLAASRYPLAMSRDAMIPSIFNMISERYVTPIFSIFFTAACMAVVILFLPVVKIAKLASGMQVMLFMAINVAIIIFRESHPQWYTPKFRSPLYPFIQVFGIVGSLILLAMLGLFVLVGTACLMLTGVLWYFYYARHKTRRRGALQKVRSKPKTLGQEEQEERHEEVIPAEMVIPLTEGEVSPESLLELGSAFGVQKISVVHLIELPDQTFLSAVAPEENAHQKALQRRLQLMSERMGLQSNIDFLLSHDRRHALYDYTKQSGATWCLIEFGRKNTFRQMRRSLGWLTSHLPCNLAIYRNEGIRVTQKILVLAEPGPEDKYQIDISNKVAELYDAEITLLSVLPENAERGQLISYRDYHDKLTHLCTTQRVQSQILQGNSITSVIEESISYDLLIIGFPHGQQADAYLHTEHDQIFERAACSVLSLKHPHPKLLSQNLVMQQESEQTRQLSELFDARTIRLQLDVKNKAELFDELSQIFSKVTDISDELLKEEFDWRERQDNTAWDNGVALPHATVEGLTRPYIGVFLLKNPILFDKESEQETDIVVCTINSVTERSSHLRLHTEITKLFSQTEFTGALKAANDTDEVLRLLRTS
ncbi:MAG TPA: hypothetical protein DCE42_17075 [Myxococcales bacterium]|nr:hypothetical protein [Myxococcales bacterium]